MPVVISEQTGDSITLPEFHRFINSPSSSVLIKSKLYAGRNTVDTVIKSNPVTGTKRLQFHLPPLHPIDMPPEFTTTASSPEPFLEAVKSEWKSICWLLFLAVFISALVGLVVYFFPPKHSKETNI